MSNQQLLFDQVQCTMEYAILIVCKKNFLHLHRFLPDSERAPVETAIAPKKNKSVVKDIFFIVEILKKKKLLIGVI